MSFDRIPDELRGEYPWQGRFLDVGGGVRMHYLDEGTGEPVVMLHGNPTWSFYWRNLVKGLSGDHRVVVPDHVGCGLSDKPQDDAYEYTLERRARDVGALLGSLGIARNVTLAVHDWGGMIGLAWAMMHPGAVRRVLLLNTAGFSLPAGQPLPWQLAAVRKHRWAEVPMRGLNLFVRGAVRDCSVRPGRMTDAIRNAYLAPHDSWASRISVQRFVDDIPLGPGDRSWNLVQRVSESLQALRRLPVLICWGGRDFVFDDGFLAEWRRRLPEAEVHRFADAGHFVLEDAHEEIVPIVREWMSRT